MSITLSISLIGFGQKDQERLQKVFDYSAGRDRAYQPGEPADIILVNGEDEAAVTEAAQLADERQTPVVTISRRPPEGVGYHIAPPLITSRVLRVLDRVTVEPPQASGAGGGDPVVAAEAEVCRYRALVVDDSLAMREALKLELSELPVALGIDFAEDGEKALELVEKTEYDLIFLDIVMPGIDGYEVCKTIRKDPRYKKTPIVMLSGKTSPLDEVKGIIAGCNTYLTKPIAHDEFQEVIRRVVKWLDSVVR